MIGVGFSIVQLAVRQLLGFNPRSLFANGEQGVWYDPSDFSTMFQDAAGTTPVTAVEQPVGLMLDKSRGLVLGPELRNNGAIGLAGSATAATYNTTTGAGEVTRVDLSNQSFVSWTFSDSVVMRRFVISCSSGQISVRSGAQGGTNIALISAGATSSLVVTPTANQITITSSSGTASFTVSSVRELPGNHAFQATSTSRPVLSARYNLLTKTELLEDAGIWQRNGLSAVQAADASGLNKLVEDATNIEHIVFQYVQLVSGTTYRIRIRAKAAERTSFSFYGAGGLNLGSSCFVNLLAGTVSGGTNATILNLGSGVYEVATDATSSFTGVNALYIRIGSSRYAGDGTSGVFVGKADLRVTNDAAGQPAYQRVNTATDYDTTGFKPYLRFDGTDDFLQTNSINFTATDKMTVFAGVRKLSDAARGILVELSASTAGNAGSFVLTAPEGAASNYGFGSRGSILISPVAASPFAAPITNVLTGIGDISGDSVILRANGAQVATESADQGTGNYGNYPLYIGRRGGTTLPFNGRIYGLIVRGDQSTAQQITAAEQYMNGKTKAY